MIGSLANSGPSDHFLAHGYSHKCGCGANWYDSDGGPCHWPCERCERLTSVDDMENDLCPACQKQEENDLLENTADNETVDNNHKQEWIQQ